MAGLLHGVRLVDQAAIHLTGLGTADPGWPIPRDLREQRHDQQPVLQPEGGLRPTGDDGGPGAACRADSTVRSTEGPNDSRAHTPSQQLGAYGGYHCASTPIAGVQDGLHSFAGSEGRDVAVGEFLARVGIGQHGWQYA
jgi:hypothetical protein